MHSSSRLLTLLAIALAAALPTAARAQAFDGAWEGSIDPADLDLRIMVDLVRTPEGLAGTLDVPLQDAFDLPLTEVEATPDGGIRFVAPDLPAAPAFEGRLRGDVIEGTFRQRDAEAPFVLRRAPADAAVPTPEGWPGTWRARLAPGVSDFELVLHLADEDGRLAGTLDLPTQGLEGLRVRFGAGSEGAVAADVPALPADARLGLREVRGDLLGTFQQAGVTFPVAFVREGSEGAGDPRPQTPRPPFPYRSEEVAVEASGATLAGTLTVPPGEGPFPAVVLLSGSGAHDRDTTLAGHAPFMVLADHLTRQGLAVLRLDDRGVGGSGGDLAQADHAVLAGDAVAAARWLADRDDVDGERIALLGHEEGALVATRAATEAEAPLAALVLLAPPAVTGEALLAEQDRRRLAAGGADEDAIAAQRAYLSDLADAHRAGDVERARTLTREHVEARLDALPAERAPGEAERERLVDLQVEVAASPAFAAFLLSRPQTWLRQVSVPTLAVFGELDTQVPADANEEPLREALGEAPTDDVTVAVLPALNHRLQPASPETVDAYGTIRTTLAEEALTLIGDWLADRLLE